MHEFSSLRVERAERLVHQQHVGIDREHAGDRHALLHAARQLRWISVLKSLEFDGREEFPCAFFTFNARHTLFLQPVKNVLQNRFPWKQREMLENDAAIGARLGDWLAGHDDFASLNRDETTDQVEQGAFPTAGWAEKRHELPFADFKRYIVESDNGTTASREVNVAHVLDLNAAAHHFNPTGNGARGVSAIIRAKRVASHRPALAVSP